MWCFVIWKNPKNGCTSPGNCWSGMTSYVGFLWQHTTNDHQHDFHWSHQTESRCFATMSGDFWFAPAVMSKKELANDWLPQLQNVLDWQGLKFIWILFPSINVKTGCHCHWSFKWHPILSPSFVKLLCHYDIPSHDDCFDFSILAKPERWVHIFIYSSDGPKCEICFGIALCDFVICPTMNTARCWNIF